MCSTFGGAFGARFFAMAAVVKFQRWVFSGASPAVLPMPAGILLPVEIAERFPALFGVSTARSASEILSFTEKLRIGQSEVNRNYRHQERRCCGARSRSKVAGGDAKVRELYQLLAAAEAAAFLALDLGMVRNLTYRRELPCVKVGRWGVKEAKSGAGRGKNLDRNSKRSARVGGSQRSKTK
jgi:hypothetical protein